MFALMWTNWLFTYIFLAKGIISNVADDEDPANIDLIKSLVRENIGGNALILLTITMRGKRAVYFGYVL